MKSDPRIGILTGALAFSAVASLVLFLGYYVPADREVRLIEAQAPAIQQHQAVVGQLLADVMEYSKRNPAIDPLLEQIGMKPSKNANATNPGAPRQAR